MKTAAEWLIDMLVTENEVILKGENFKLFEQAKEMEKEQIKNSFEAGVDYGSDIILSSQWGENTEELNFEQYYNETYKK